MALLKGTNVVAEPGWDLVDRTLIRSAPRRNSPYQPGSLQDPVQMNGQSTAKAGGRTDGAALG